MATKVLATKQQPVKADASQENDHNHNHDFALGYMGGLSNWIQVARTICCFC